MYLCRDLTSLSLADIARAFDRDHSTVMHAIRAVDGRIEPGSDTANAIHDVKSALRIGATPPAWVIRSRAGFSTALRSRRST